MAVTPGSSTKINSLAGLTRQLSITSTERAEQTTNTLPSNIFVVESDTGYIYLTDGTTALSDLTPFIDVNILPLTSAERAALNLSFSTGSYVAAEGGVVVAGTDAKIADAQLNLVDTNGRLVASYLQDVLTDEDGIVLLEKLPSQMRAHMIFVDTYADLDVLTDSQKLNLIFVVDASGDETVDSGWAIYAYNVDATGAATGEPIKLAEGEGLDVDFDAIASTYENIQAAGAVMYDHTVLLEAPTLSDYLTLAAATEEEEGGSEPANEPEGA